MQYMYCTSMYCVRLYMYIYCTSMYRVRLYMYMYCTSIYRVRLYMYMYCTSIYHVHLYMYMYCTSIYHVHLYMVHVLYKYVPCLFIVCHIVHCNGYCMLKGTLSRTIMLCRVTRNELVSFKFPLHSYKDVLSVFIQCRSGAYVETSMTDSIPLIRCGIS